MTSKAKKNVQKQTPPVERGGGSGGEGVTGSIQKQNITRYPNEYKRFLPSHSQLPKGKLPPPVLLSSKTQSRNKTPLILGGIALYTLSVYGAYVYISTAHSASAEPVHTKPLGEQEDISHVYDTIAKNYDKEIWKSELFMGMLLLRRSMAKRAKGNVLEVSAGTGRNIKYYTLSGKKIKSLTMVDSSAPMLQIAREAFMKRYPDFQNVTFKIQDAAAPLSPPEGGKFDTIIQSMGMCSHHSPVKLLRNLGYMCKDDGSIILLEHGKSHYEWLNRILDRFADRHAETWGCWWNRDIEDILKDSGLRVVKLKRYHFGTTYWIEAKPPVKGSGEKQ